MACNIAELVRGGYLKEGDVPFVVFLGQKWKGLVTECTTGPVLMFDGVSYDNPGKAALACVRTIKPMQIFVNGWQVRLALRGQLCMSSVLAHFLCGPSITW